MIRNSVALIELNTPLDMNELWPTNLIQEILWLKLIKYAESSYAPKQTYLLIHNTLLKFGLNVKEQIPQHSVLNEKNGLLLTMSIILKYPSNPESATHKPLSILYSA